MTGDSDVIASDHLDLHAIRLFGERPEVARIGRKHRSVRLRERNDECIYGRPPPSPTPQQGGSSCERLAQFLRDTACLQKSVGHRIATGVTLGAFDQDDRRHNRRPQCGVAQRGDQRGRAARLLSEPAHAAGIQHEHGALSSAATRLPAHSRDESLGLLAIARRRLAHPIHESPHIAVGLGQELEASQLGTKCTLKQFGG